MRRYAIKSLYNMRDLGGHPTVDGKFTSYRKLIRSDCPSTFDESDIEQIESLNITQVIDLRTEEECRKRPSAYMKLPEVKYHICSFATGDIAPKEEFEIPKGYMAMFEDHDTIRNVIKLIANNEEGSTVFHCAVGKDRTGIISSILLGICKVPIQDILADYQVSYTYLKSFIDELIINNPHLPNWIGQSKREYMSEAMELISEKHGNFENYLKVSGIEESEIELIRRKLLG